jgi:hypothetical protein
LKRLLLRLMVAGVMGAMVLALAVPAFAGGTCTGEPLEVQQCSGGLSVSSPGGISNGSVGGGGGHAVFQCNSESECEEFSSSGGGGGQVLGEDQGGFGFHCEPSFPDCVGSGFTGGPD